MFPFVAIGESIPLRSDAIGTKTLSVDLSFATGTGLFTRSRDAKTKGPGYLNGVNEFFMDGCNDRDSWRPLTLLPYDSTKDPSERTSRQGVLCELPMTLVLLAL